MTDYDIPYPDPKIFESRSTPKDSIMREAKPVPMLDRVEYPGSGDPEGDGILIFKVGAMFPEKGFPFPEAIWSINVVKKTVIQFARILNSWQFLPALALIVIFPAKPLLNRLLDAFNRISEGVMGPYYVSSRYRMAITEEIQELIRTFILEMGFGEGGQAYRFAKTFAHIVEYDTAYRYRLLDIMSESSRAKWIESPRKELRRLTEIFMEREPNFDGVALKIRRLLRLLSLMLLSPKISRALKLAFFESRFENFQYDEIDRYWCMLRSDYDYMGEEFEERMERLESLGIPFPPLYKISLDNVK